MLAHLERWMRDFRIDGIRLDSIENIANWDFVQEFKNHARHLWQIRSQEQYSPRQGQMSVFSSSVRN